ncbi:MAG TPA: hypothetical protein VKZ91_00685 [Woeseiaceae bacterium]|nr:hypothetical protein [Woeseiaceae bacterium]
MSRQQTSSNDWAATITKSTVRLGYWTAAWVATLAVATFGPTFIWQSRAASSIAILVNLAVGVGMILAHKRHLKSLDEMHQKIQLEAMGLSMGVGLIAGLAWSTADMANVIPFDAEIGALVILMALAYMAGIFAGYRRYR